MLVKYFHLMILLIYSISISHNTIQSCFRRENKIIIEGKKCFKSGPYITKNNNIFSFSFSVNMVLCWKTFKYTKY